MLRVSITIVYNANRTRDVSGAASGKLSYWSLLWSLLLESPLERLLWNLSMGKLPIGVSLLEAFRPSTLLICSVYCINGHDVWRKRSVNATNL